MNRHHVTRGSALLIALVFVAVFGALAVGYLAATSADLEASRLYLHSRRAHFAAESGMSLARRILPAVSVQQAETTGETLQALTRKRQLLAQRFQLDAADIVTTAFEQRGGEGPGSDALQGM